MLRVLGGIFLPLCYLRPLQLTAIGTERTKGGRRAEKPPPLSALVAGVSSARLLPGARWEAALPLRHL